MRIVRSLLAFLVASTLLTSICFAEAPDRIGTIDSGKVVPLPSQVQRMAKPEFDLGRVDGSFQLHVTLLTVPTPSQATALKQLLEQQQDPKSPYFHKWLTPAQFADRFGLSHNDIQKASAWLKSQGFKIENVGHGRDWIVFSGTAYQVESAFRTEIHHYNVNGEMHFANSAPPSIPAALAGIAAGFRGLTDFGPKPMIRKALPRARNVRPNYYDNNTGDGNFLGPGDIATIYDLTPLYSAGTDGTGEKLVIVGQTDVYLADLVDFRTGFSLPAIFSGCTATSGVLTACTVSSTANFQYVLNGADPGVSLGDLTEADLDLEWSAATARGAQIIYVNTAPGSGGVFASLAYAVDGTASALAPVISMSYGLCEWNDGGDIEVTSGGVTVPGPGEMLLQKAASEGITVLNSSGDSGAAECDGGPTLATGGLGVSFPASSPEVTGVGGTAIPYVELTTSASTYWNTSNGTNGDSAKSYIPETAWNEDEELTAISNTQLYWQTTGYIISEGGGGVSNCALQNAAFTLCVSGFPVPSFQSALAFTTPPATAGRYSPDVSLLASPDFPGYVFCTPVEELSTTGSTSTASGCAGGIAGAVNGVVAGNPPAYVVTPSIVGGTSASAPVFAGMVTMLNQYLNATGGLGPINSTLYKLAATPANLAFHQVTTGDNMVYCSGDTPNPSYEISPLYLCPGATGTTDLFGWSASNADTGTGYNLVTGLGSVDGDNLFIAWKANLGSFALTPSAGSVTAVAGHNSTTTTITVTPSGSFSSAVTFSCTTGLPAGATCGFNPPGSATSTVMTFTTLADMATAANTAVTVSATGGGVTNTTTVDLTVTATDQTFTLAAQTGTVQVTPGQPGSFTIGVNGTTHGYSVSQYQLTFTCSESMAAAAPLLASGSTCTVSPSIPTTIPNTTTFPVSLSVTTVGPTGRLRTPFGNSRGIFYAALLPGLLGILFTAGSRKRSLRGIRFLSLVLLLGFSTLWLGSCSSSSSHGNPGTPPGSYPIVVNAATGGAVPVTSSVTVTLTVQ